MVESQFWNRTERSSYVLYCPFSNALHNSPYLRQSLERNAVRQLFLLLNVINKFSHFLLGTYSVPVVTVPDPGHAMVNNGRGFPTSEH